MLETTRGSLNLKDLETRLQEGLREKLGLSLPINVSCLLRADNLLILVYSPESVSLSPQDVFPHLRAILAQEPISDPTQVQMYLIVQGKQAIGQSLESNLELPPLQILPAKSEPAISNWLFQFKSRLSPKLLMVIAGFGGGLTLFVGCLYVLTRPCVFSNCPNITQSQQLAQDALVVWQNSPSNPNLLAVQEKLNLAIKQLKEIPQWSKYHPEASAILELYQDRSDSLNHIIQALNLATQAVSSSQNPPFPVAQWLKTKQLWQDSLAHLKQVPPESPFYSFALSKIREYESSLVTVEQRLNLEKQAKINLSQGIEAGKIAQSRQDTAQSLAELQLVYMTWKTAVERLQAVSAGTTSYQDAQKLLSNYRTELTNAGKIKNQEETAVNLYNRATEAAKIAQNSAQNNQWSNAVSSWREGLIYLKQIPKNTFKANQVSPLITSYTISLNQAQSNLKNAIKLQEIKRDLAQTCQGTPEICKYTITPKTIQVRLTSNYLQQVWQTALQAKAQANLYGQIELLNHISRLEQSWQIISNKTGKVVEIYDANGKLMISYEPKN